MYTRNSILKKLRSFEKMDELKWYRFGLAGSYVRREETPKSDIDIIVDTDMMSPDLVELVKSKFNIEVDVVQLGLLKEDDKRLDEFTRSQDLPINTRSAYKEICREVQWC